MKRSFADYEGGEQKKAEKKTNSTETSLIGNHVDANVTTHHYHVKPRTKAARHVYSNKPIFKRKLIEKYSTARYNLNTKLVCNSNLKNGQINGSVPLSLPSGKRNGNAIWSRVGDHKLKSKFAFRTNDSKENVNENQGNISSSAAAAVSPTTTFSGLTSTESDQTKTLLEGTAEPWCISLLPSSSEQTEFAFSSYSDFCENNNADSLQCDSNVKMPLYTVPNDVPDTDESKVTSTERPEGSGLSALLKVPKNEAIDSSTCSASGANSSDSTGGTRWKIVSNNVYRYMFEQYEMEKKIGRRRKKKGRGKPKSIPRDPNARYIDPYENFVSDVDEQSGQNLAANDKVGMLMYVGVNRPLFPVTYRNLRALNNNEENDHIVTDFWSEFALSTLVTSAPEGKLVKKVFVPVKHPKLRSLVSEYSRECNDAWKDVNLSVEKPTPILIGSSTCRKADSSPEASTIKVKRRRTKRSHLIMPESDYKAYELRSVDKKISELEDGIEIKPDISDITDGMESEVEEEEGVSPLCKDETIVDAQIKVVDAEGETPIRRPEKLGYIPTKVELLKKYGFKECVVQIPALDPETVELYVRKPTTRLSPTEGKPKPVWLARNESTAMSAAEGTHANLIKEEYAEIKPNVNGIPSSLVSECAAEEGTRYFGNRNCSRTFQTIVNYTLRNRTSVFHYKIVKMLDFQKSNNKFFKVCDIIRVVKRDTSAAIDVLSSDRDDVEGTRKSALVIQNKRSWEDMWRRDLSAVMKDESVFGLETDWKNGDATIAGKEEAKIFDDTMAAATVDDNTTVVSSIVHVKMDQLKSLKHVKWLKVKLNRSKVSLCYAQKHLVRHKRIFEMIYRADLSKKVLCVFLEKEEQRQPATEVDSLFGVYAFPGLCETVLVGPYYFHDDHKLNATVTSENGDVLKAHVRMSEEKENVPQTDNVGEAISVKWWWSSMKVGFEEMNESYLKFLFSPLCMNTVELEDEKINLKQLLEDHMCYDYEKYVNYRGEPNFVLYHDPNVFSIRDTSKIIRVDISLDNTQTSRLRERTKKLQRLENEKSSRRKIVSKGSKKEATEVKQKTQQLENDHIQSERIRRLIFRRRRDDLAKMLTQSPKPEQSSMPVPEYGSVSMPLVSVIYKAKDMIELLENNTRDLIGQGVELRKIQKVLLTKYISMLRELSYDTRIVQHGNRFLNEWKLQKSRDKAKLDGRLKALQKEVKDTVPSVQEAYQKIESNYHNALALASTTPATDQTTSDDQFESAKTDSSRGLASAKNSRSSKTKRSGTFSSGDSASAKKPSFTLTVKPTANSSRTGVSRSLAFGEKRYSIIKVKSSTPNVAAGTIGTSVAHPPRVSGRRVVPSESETLKWMPNINANMLMREEEYITVAPKNDFARNAAATVSDDPKVYQDKNGRLIRRRKRRRTREEMAAAREEMLAKRVKRLVARQEMLVQTKKRKELINIQAKKNSYVQVYPEIEDRPKGEDFDLPNVVPSERAQNYEAKFGPSFSTGPVRKIFTEHSYSYVPLSPAPSDDDNSDESTTTAQEEPAAAAVITSASTSKPAPIAGANKPAPTAFQTAFAPSESGDDSQFRTVIRQRDDNCVTIDLIENHKAFARVNICKMGGGTSPTRDASLGTSRLKVVNIIEKMLHRIKTIELENLPEDLPKERMNALKRTILVRRLQTIIQKYGRQQIGNTEIIEISDDELEEAEAEAAVAAATKDWDVDVQADVAANRVEEVYEEEETVAETGGAFQPPPCEDSMMVNEIVISNEEMSRRSRNETRMRVVQNANAPSTVKPATAAAAAAIYPSVSAPPKKMVLTNVRLSPPNGGAASANTPITVRNLKIVQVLRSAVDNEEGTTTATTTAGAGMGMPLIPTNLRLLRPGLSSTAARQVIKVPSDFLKNITIKRKSMVPVLVSKMKEALANAKEEIGVKPKWYSPVNAEEAPRRVNGAGKFYMGLNGVILDEEKVEASAATASERKLGIRSFAGIDRFNENLPANIEKLLIANKQE